MKPNYFQICQNLLKGLPERQREIISRRFGLGSLSGGDRRETLEFIGESYGITRERVRQIENEGLSRIKSKTKQYQKVFQFFKDYLKEAGKLKKEDILLEDLGSENQKPQTFFLLNLKDDFERFGETEEFYPFWTIDKNSPNLAKKVINSSYDKIKKSEKPLPLKSLTSSSLSKNALNSVLEISKKIQKNPEGLFGLRDWPEINPRGVKDKAYLVLKKENKPLHFTEVAESIPDGLVQTVHNELIKDPRFILVGRGIYGLREWGYQSGPVKEVIFNVLKQEKKPLAKEEILNRVLEQRLVKENTVLLNLSDKKYFFRNSQGKYTIKES